MEILLFKYLASASDFATVLIFWCIYKQYKMMIKIDKRLTRIEILREHEQSK